MQIFFRKFKKFQTIIDIVKIMVARYFFSFLKNSNSIKKYSVFSCKLK